MKFLDRVEERTRLMKLLNGADGALACLYGRRRCGKTRLLHECVAGLPNTVYYLADRSDMSGQTGHERIFYRQKSSKRPLRPHSIPISAACGSVWLQPFF